MLVYHSAVFICVICLALPTGHSWTKIMIIM